MERDMVVLGRYRLRERVGADRMTEWYRASEERPPEANSSGGPYRSAGEVRPAKLLRRLPGRDTEPLLLDESLLSARHYTNIDAPTVLPETIEVDDERNIWFCSPWQEGATLRALLELGRAATTPMPLPAILHLGRSVARDLATIHRHTDAQGINLRLCLRTLDPQAVFVERSGAVSLIGCGLGDFISHFVEQELEARHLAYLSPEQAHGLPLDQPTDLFSLGVMLQELWISAPLFIRKTPLETVRAIQALNRPPLTSLGTARQLPVDFERLVDDLLHREAPRRPSAEEAGQRLAALQTSLEGMSEEDGQRALAAHLRGLTRVLV